MTKIVRVRWGGMGTDRDSVRCSMRFWMKLFCGLESRILFRLRINVKVLVMVMFT